MRPIRVLLVDDHRLIRVGLRSLLESLPRIAVVGEASNGRQALEQTKALAPLVILMDLMMPELNGIEATRQITHEFPNARIMIMSFESREDLVAQAFKSGAAGFMLKDFNPVELEFAISAVARGESYLSPAICQQLVTACRISPSESPNALRKLTQRQREILQLLAEGNTTKLIAIKLGVSPKTVETHRTDLMEALNIFNVAGLTRFAIQMGLVTSEA